MATEIMAKAALATSDADLQTQLGLKAFPAGCAQKHCGSCVVGISCRSRKPSRRRTSFSLSRKMKTVLVVQIFMVESDPTPSVEEPKPDIQQIVKACIKQMQAQQPREQRSERPRSSRRKLRCWCCGEEGHTLRECPVIQQNKAAYFKQSADNQAEN